MKARQLGIIRGSMRALADYRAATEGVEFRKDKDRIDTTPAADKNIFTVMKRNAIRSAWCTCCSRWRAQMGERQLGQCRGVRRESGAPFLMWGFRS